MQSLLSTTVSSLQSKLELFDQNYVKKTYDNDRFVYYGEYEKACNSRGKKTSDKFDHPVIILEPEVSKDRFRIRLSACADPEKVIEMMFKTDAKTPTTVEESLKFMDKLELAENETYRIIEFGNGNTDLQFRLKIYKTDTGISLYYQINQIDYLRMDYSRSNKDKSENLEITYTVACAKLRFPYRSGTPCFNGSEWTQRIEKSKEGLRYFDNDGQISKNKFDELFAKSIGSRFKYTSVEFFKNSFGLFPATSIAVDTSGESQFVKDLKQARLRLLLGDTTLTRKLLEKNIEKIKSGKVKVTEF